MKDLFVFALILAAVGFLATCSRAGTPLETYVAGRPGVGVHAILGELRGRETVLSTNASPARVRSAAEKLIVQDAVPMLTTKAAWKAAPDKDAHLDAAIRVKLDNGATLGETRRIIAILTTRAVIAREGRTLSWDDGDEAQPDVVTAKLGEPLWKRIGLDHEPEPEEIRRARGDK